jgi:ubiquitin-conjugating enzyme E2 variant
MEILMQVILGWLLADLWSGVFHAVGDSETFGNNRIVKAITGKNESHHDNPLGLVTQSFFERNMTSWIGTAAIAIIWFYFFGISAMLLSMIVGGLMVSEVHRWAHAPSLAPAWVRVLQETGIFQSPKHHSKHHKPPHSVRFCVLTNFINPFLDVFINMIRLK